MIKNIKAITALSYLSMFFLGVAASLIGAAAKNIGLSPTQIGLMIAVQNIGFMISVLISGALADTYEKPRILFMGSVILAFSFLTFYLSDTFNINLFIMGLIGVGIGTYEGVTDAMLLDIHPKRESLHINVNHFFVTFGSIIIAVYLTFLQMNWRNAIIQSGLVVIFLALLYALTRLKNKRRSTEAYTKRLRVLTQEKLVILVFIATALVVGVEAGTAGILTTFLMDLRGFTQVTSKIGLITFLVGIASGRLILGYITPKEQITRYVLALTGTASFVFAGLYYIDLGAFTYPIIFIAGLCISGLLPLMLSLVGIIYKGMAGTVLGAIKVAIPVGGIILPFIMAILTKYAGFQAALIVFPLAFVVCFVILFSEFRSNQATEREPI